jgi:hypothetical protein
MRLEEKSLLYDVCTACELILRFTAGKSYVDYAADEACRSAVERQFITVGEALDRLGKLNPPMAQKFRGSAPLSISETFWFTATTVSRAKSFGGLYGRTFRFCTTPSCCY